MNRSFEWTLVEQGAPTLAGEKPASFFRYQSDGVAAIRRAVGQWDCALRPLGLRVRILAECPDAHACTILLYRPAWLESLLADPARRAFLAQRGYEGGDLPGLLRQLSARMCPGREYPHEIGVFLGYPLEDVIGFIENRGWNYTCCGCWKAYGDPVAARRCFARFRACTEHYKRRFAQGDSILQLVVAS